MADGKLDIGATTGSWFVGITTVKTAHPNPDNVCQESERNQITNQSADGATRCSEWSCNNWCYYFYKCFNC